MKVAPTERIAQFDIDDTLIFWEDDYRKPGADKVEVQCPYDNTWTYHRIHVRHINFLKKLKARGYTIVVWSAAGTAWAEAVVKALNLVEYVDWVQAKPTKVIDDLPNPEEIIGKPFWLDPKGKSL